MRQRDVCGAGFEPFPADAANADDGVLAIGAGLALEAERIFEVESDDGVAREFQKEKSQRANGDGSERFCFCQPSPMSAWRSCTSASVAASSLSIRSSALTPKPLRPLTIDEGLLCVFGREFVTHLGGAAWGEHDKCVGEVNGIVGGFRVAETAQGFRDDVLHIRLARVDDVVDRNGRFGEMRRGGIGLESGRGPDRFAFRQRRAICGS